ncbi:hypothetical protein [Hydrogenophaga sp.]|uniref:hypothetical protein n=1 Tax=Hydrogenophaga sp. TaxID=1904254 RepID=UPI00356A48C8
MKRLHPNGKAENALLAFCVVFLWGAAANVDIGITGFVMGIPFAIGLLALLHRRSWRFITATVCLAFGPLVGAIASDPPASRLHYPTLGAAVEVPAGWGYVNYQSEAGKNYLASPERLARPRTGGAAVHAFAQPLSLRLIRVETTHPDFVLHYHGILEDARGTRYDIDERELLESVAMGLLWSPTLAGEPALHRPWLHWLGNLMYWPLAPMAPFILF